MCTRMKVSLRELERLILEDLKGEPSHPQENMVDVAIRLLKEHPKHKTGVNCQPLEHRDAEDE